VKIYDEQHNFAGYLVKDKDGYCLSGASDSSVKNVNLFRKRIKTGMPWNKELLYWLAVCEAMAFFGCLVWLMVQTPSPGQTYCFLFVPSGLFFILPPFCMLMRLPASPVQRRILLRELLSPLRLVWCIVRHRLVNMSYAC
jgi:hypothetical protein